MILDMVANIIGLGSLLALYFLYRHSDSLSDGNIGAADDHS